MTLQEAINHIDEIIKDIKCEECIKEHLQLKKRLLELNERRENEEKN